MSDRFADRYDIQREIGRGAFGVVYLAHDTRLRGLPVAVKILHPALSVAPLAWCACSERGWRADYRRFVHAGLRVTSAVPCVQGVQENDRFCTQHRCHKLRA